MQPLEWSEAHPVIEVRVLEGVPGPRWFGVAPQTALLVVSVAEPPTRPLALAVACDAPLAAIRFDGVEVRPAGPSGWCETVVVPISAEVWADGALQIELVVEPRWASWTLGDVIVGHADVVGPLADARRWEAASSHRLAVAGWVGWLLVAVGHTLLGARVRDRTSLAYGVGLCVMAAGELTSDAYFAVVGPWWPLVVVLLGNVFGTVVLTLGLGSFFGLRRGFVAAVVALELTGLVPGCIPLMMVGWLLAGLACLTVGVRRRRAETGWAALALLLVFPYNLWVLLVTLGITPPESLYNARWLYIATPPLTGTAMLVHRHLATWRNAQRFVPHDFLQALGHTDLAELAYGEHVERTMVVWFSDVRGFTALLEGLTADRVPSVLELSLGAQETVIRRHGGFVDKYIGDAVMALFTDADAAVAAALEARRAVSQGSGGKLSVGIGLHRGQVLLGTVGSADRMDCTVVGDSVNLASRVEGATKRYGAAILVTGAVRDALTSPVLLRPAERVVVKGRSQEVELVEVLDAELDAARVAVVEGVAAARARLDAGDLEGAVPLLRALKDQAPDDGLIVRLCERGELWARDGVPDRPDVVSLHEK